MQRIRLCGQTKSISNLNNASCVILATLLSLLLGIFITDVEARWPTHQQEIQDEVNDMKILNAVQESMKDYEKLHKHHRHKRAEKSVCYGDELGCFEDSGPFGYLDMLPQSPEEIGTKFHFYSTENRSDVPLLDIPYLNMSRMFYELNRDENANDTFIADNSTILTPEIQKNILKLKSFEGFDRLSIRVIVHGFGSACHHVWIYEMRTALMAVEDCIVICVDWEAGASLPNYVRASANTRLVGKKLALLLKNLQKHKGLNLDRVHLIGFSLGAHVSGFTGSELPGLKRITGLDPAGPLFESQHIKARLDSTDANFVDVIHSNGENLILGGLGSWQPMGDADFYPNGGRVQNGCSNIFVGAVTDFIWSPGAVVEGRSLCNHRRAYKFFIDSIASKCIFPAFPCDSYDDFLKGNCFPCDENNYKDSRCGNMGYYADKSTGRGQLYLVTREEEPFCAHQFHLEVHTSESDLPLRTIGKIEATLNGEHFLNETFSITDKDDAELFAGDVISRILVPHPALGFPKTVALTYKTYSGWLSKGLPHWNINKIVLTDSFGKSYSMCRNYMLLESGNPVLIKLQPGVCEITDENDVTFTPFEAENNGKRENNNENNGSDDVDKLREKKNVLNLGTNYKINGNKTYVFPDRTNNLQWQPVLENGNSLERNSAESSRSLHSFMPGEIFEPILKNRQRPPKVHTGRSFNIDEEKKPNVFAEEEIMEPILKATTARSRKMKQVPLEGAHSQRDNSYFSVQLLPFRLGEIFERAERYARETLLPLISEQAPRFFGFGADRNDPNQRQPKYIPRFGDIKNDTVIRERRLNLPPILNDTVFVFDNPGVDDTDFDIPHDRISGNDSQSNDAIQSRSDIHNVFVDAPASKNILSLLRTREKRTTESPVEGFRHSIPNEQSRSLSSNYYTNPEAIKTDDNLKVVRINLPTYKPPAKSLPLFSSNPLPRTHFPYQFEIPTDPL